MSVNQKMTALADTIRSKTGGTDKLSIDGMTESVNGLVKLPELTNEGSAADVLAGKEFIDADGTIVAGTMPNNGSVAAMITPASPDYHVPAGFHSGEGEVRVAVEDKTVTPTKEEQVLTATTKFMRTVTVAPIPDAYQDVTEVTAFDEGVLVGTKFVDNDGEVIEGAMPNIGEESVFIDAVVTSHTISEGYHNGTGKVSVVPEEKSATPTKSAQTVTPDAGKVLSKVTVAPIPDAYQDVTEVDATAQQVLEGFTIVDAEGNVIEGAMTDHGDLGGNITIDAENYYYDIPEGYHNGGGSVNVMLEEKTVTPTDTQQIITPSAGCVLSKVTVEAVEGSGEGGAGTCTVTIGTDVLITFCVPENGLAGIFTLRAGNYRTLTLPCGALLYCVSHEAECICLEGEGFDDVTIENIYAAYETSSFGIIAPLTPNATATVTIYDDV